MNNNDYMNYVQTIFDYNHEKYVYERETIKIPDIFRVGLIVGSSGSGKTKILDSLGEKYDNIIFDFDHETNAIEQVDSDPEKAVDKLFSVGFSSVPQWFIKYGSLSEGQKCRCALAKCVKKSYIKLDEFTSKLDRITARNTSFNLSKFVKKMGYTNIIIASPFRDIMPYLSPDWVYDTSQKSFISYDKRKCKWEFSFVSDKNEIVLDIDKEHLYIIKSDVKRWEFYKNYHYLSGNILYNCEYWELFTKCENFVIPIGYIAVAPLPTKGYHAKREHRLVVIPEMQGMGVGVSFSEFIANYYATMKVKGNNSLYYRYYCKTSHPKLGNYRNNNVKLWKKTPRNGKYSYGDALSYTRKTEKIDDTPKTGIQKIYYCHEYVGHADIQLEDSEQIKQKFISDTHNEKIHSLCETSKVSLDSVDGTPLWKPRKIFGVITQTHDRVSVKFRHKMTNFFYTDYEENEQQAKEAAAVFLQKMNLTHNNPNMYFFDEQSKKYFVSINDKIIISLDEEVYKKIGESKLIIDENEKKINVFYYVDGNNIKSRKRKKIILNKEKEYKIEKIIK